MDKNKALGATGAVSGAASVLGSWQVCHSVCLGIVALLGIIGISVAGMPLAFLNVYAVPLWSVAAFLLLVTLVLRLSKGCISDRQLLFNGGLVVAGVPFSAVQPWLPAFWTIGGLMVVSAIVWYCKRKMKPKPCCAHGGA